MSDRRIKRIKFSKDRHLVNIKWQQMDDIGNWGDFELKLRQEPNPDFVKAFNALGEEARQILEYPKDELNLVEVRSVSFGYKGDEDVMGVSISVMKDLRNRISGYSATTPYLSEDFIAEGGDDKVLLPDSTKEKLETLCEHALKYVDGERSQLNLELNNEESDEEAGDEDEELSDVSVGGNGAVHEEEAEEVFK